jgi:hypothetical protein
MVRYLVLGSISNEECGQSRAGILSLLSSFAGSDNRGHEGHLLPGVHMKLMKLLKTASTLLEMRAPFL